LSAGSKGATRGLSTCAAYARSQNQSFWLAEGRRRLIWWSRTLDKLSTVEMCPVIAAASVVRVPGVPRVHERRRGALAGRAEAPGTSCEARFGRRWRPPDVFGHRSVVEGLHQPNKATTTLAETKRQVLISGKCSAGRKTNDGARSQRRPHCSGWERTRRQENLAVPRPRENPQRNSDSTRCSAAVDAASRTAARSPGSTIRRACSPKGDAQCR
jgi:hypothetical protein